MMVVSLNRTLFQKRLIHNYAFLCYFNVIFRGDKRNHKARRNRRTHALRASSNPFHPQSHPYSTINHQTPRSKLKTLIITASQVYHHRYLLIIQCKYIKTRIWLKVKRTKSHCSPGDIKQMSWNKLLICGT